MDKMKQANKISKRAGFCSWQLDEANLSAAEFRVFMHLERRAGANGRAFPGIDSMARICNLSKPTVIKAVRSLQDRGMIDAQKAHGRTTRYRIINDPEKWALPATSKKATSKNGVTPTGKKEITEADPGSRSDRSGSEARSRSDRSGSVRENLQKRKVSDPLQGDLPFREPIETKLPEPLKRCFALFRKRETTPLDRSEKIAWKIARPVVEQTSAEEWSLLEWEYASKDEDVCRFRRQGLSALLNNWNEEISRAASRKSKIKIKREPFIC